MLQLVIIVEKLISGTEFEFHLSPAPFPYTPILSPLLSYNTQLPNTPNPHSILKDSTTSIAEFTDPIMLV